MKMYRSQGTEETGVTGQKNPKLSALSLLDAIGCLEPNKYLLLEVAESGLSSVVSILNCKENIIKVMSKISNQDTFNLEELAFHKSIFIKVNNSFKLYEWRITISDTKNFKETQQIEKLTE